MTLDEYQAQAVATATYPADQAITYPILGLNGEAGEVADKWKKYLRGDHETACPKCASLAMHYRCLGCGTVFRYTNKYSDCGNAACEGEKSESVPCPRCEGAHPDERARKKAEYEVARELGDVMWYIAALARDLGFTLEEIATSNLAKLRDRQARGVVKGSGDNR